MRRIVPLLFAAAAAGGLVRSQAPDAAALAAMPAREKKPHQQTTLVTPPLTAAESRAVVATIQSVRALLLATPALQALHGYDWATYARIVSHDSGRPLTMTLGYIAYPYWFNARAGRAESSAEGAPFTISINDPDVVVGQGGYLVDEEAHFTFAPTETGTLGGFPVYGEDRLVALTTKGRPLFVSVTQGEFLALRTSQAKAAFDSMRAALAELPDSADKRNALSKAEGRFTAFESERAGLSDAQRASPALYSDGAPTSRPSFLADAGSTRARAIVKVNPALFQPGAPRTSVQVIVLGTVRYLPALYSQVQTQIDIPSLAALLN